MNIHPMFVHFPIALLTLYSALELVRFRKITSLPYWFYVKSVLVIFGSLGSYATYFTGSMAKHLITDQTLRPLIRQHETWAQIVLVIYTLLAAAYLVAWCNRGQIGYVLSKFPLVGIIWNIGTGIAKFIMSTPISILLAIAGFVSLTITGALGGSIVYGSTIDPVTNWIYHLFFTQ